MKKHIVCYGDSNTHGYCAANDGRFDENERWPRLLNRSWGKIISFSRKACLAGPPVLTIRSTRACPGWIIFTHAS